MRDLPGAGIRRQWLWSLRGVIIVAGCYGLVHGAFRVFASPAIGQDDVIVNFYAQTLEAGYAARQGPIYEWMLWLVQQATGPVGSSFLILKYALLTVAAAFFFLSARRILEDQFWAALAAFSLSLVYQIGWNIHEGVTHTAALTCFICATFWAYLRVVDRGRLSDYALFGIFAGLGMLAKFTFGAFFLMLAAASCMQGPTRRRFYDRRMLLGLAVVLAVMSPYLWWLLADYDVITKISARSVVSIGAAGGTYVERLLTGLPRVVAGPVGFLSPLIFVLVVIFPGSVRDFLTARREKFRFAPEPDYVRLIHHLTIVALVFLFLTVVIFGFQRLFARYMHPFFLLTVIGLISYAMNACRDERQIRRYVTIMIVFAVAVFPLRAGYLFVGAPFCIKCRQMVPYGPLADVLRRRGFETGTLMGGYRHVAGNMRKYFPKARIIALKGPVYVPPTRHPEGAPIAVVWNPRTEGWALPERAKLELEKIGVRAFAEPETVQIPWKHVWKPDGYRHSEWRYLVIRPSSPEAGTTKRQSPKK